MEPGILTDSAQTHTSLSTALSCRESELIGSAGEFKQNNSL